MTFVLATRRSRLALRQTEEVAAALRARYADLEVVPLALSTRGDEILDRSLAPLGGKGLFVKALERALADGRARAAVHSLKDVPTVLGPGFVLAAVTRRAAAHDVLIAPGAAGLEDLPRQARIGTASLRRAAQLLAARPDLAIVTVRGAVETRLARLDAGELDGLVLAAAGLARLGIDRGAPLPSTVMLPASGQGALAIEVRAEDEEAREIAAALDDPGSRLAAEAERAFCRALGADCASPVAAFAQSKGGVLRLEVRVASPDGLRLLAGERSGRAAEAEKLGAELAAELLARGAGALLRNHAQS